MHYEHCKHCKAAIARVYSARELRVGTARLPKKIEKLEDSGFEASKLGLCDKCFKIGKV